MPRPLRILSDRHPYHITARCTNREWFHLPMSLTWEIFSDYLFLVHHMYEFQIHAFVLMSNHFHLLASTPQGNISTVMHYFLTSVSKEISYQAGRTNQTFGGPYYSSLIANSFHYHHAYKYLYRNPVSAGLVKNVEQYEWSTLRGLLGFRQLIIPVCDDHILFPDLEGTLRWMNNKLEKSDQQMIRRALRRKVFTFPQKSQPHRSKFLDSHII